MEFKYEGKSLKAGIYKITNTANGKVYIGSAREFKERWKQHKSSLLSGKHHNKHLQGSFDKYGESVFVFEVLEVTKGTTKNRRNIEQKYINEYLDRWEMCYNLDKHTRNPQKHRAKSSEERSKKISEANRKRWADPAYRKRVSEAMKNSWTQEVREEASKRLSGSGNPMAGRILSSETREKISRSSKEMWKDENIRKRIIKGLSDRTRKQWQNPVVRALMTIKIRETKSRQKV